VADELIGQSHAMRELRERIAEAAAVRSTVLLHGETGTGKGLVARCIHAASECAAEPFVQVDCAALSPALQGSELLGHERGGLPWVDAEARGRFERAGRGSVFLDEVSDLDPRLQRRLLCVLDQRSYERVGGGETLEMAARIIASSSRDLLGAVARGGFSEELYFRLNVIRIEVPALRERLADVPLLVRAGLDRLSGSLGLDVPRVSDCFYERLLRHDWPGNVRELMNVLERVLARSRGRPLEGNQLDGELDRLSPRRRPDPPKTAVRAANELAAVLVATGGNVARAARRLGIPRSTLRYRIRRHDLGDLIPSD
jgi:DNA-binding NtrC family response regulator